MYSKLKSRSFFVLILFLCSCLVQGQTKLNSCHGLEKAIRVISGLPYVEAEVGQSTGLFLVDFGTTTSTIDPKGFATGTEPSPVAGTIDSFANFNFYGSWGTVKLNIQDHSNIAGVRQAGIIGTDFLSLNGYTIDFTSQKMYRPNERVCLDNILKTEGFVPISSAGYYASNVNRLQSCAFNIPTVPVRIGRIQAVAQIDPGFDDRLYRHPVNINKAYFDALQQSGLKLIRFPEADLRLTTCTGSTEDVQAYKLPSNSAFEVVDAKGGAVLRASDAVLFLKNPSPEVQQCAGIGTWKIPAAQFGASFMLDSKSILFDPFSSMVWIKSKSGQPSNVRMQSNTQQPGRQMPQQIGYQIPSGPLQVQGSPQQVQQPRKH